MSQRSQNKLRNIIRLVSQLTKTGGANELRRAGDATHLWQKTLQERKLSREEEVTLLMEGVSNKKVLIEDFEHRRIKPEEDTLASFQLRLAYEIRGLGKALGNNQEAFTHVERAIINALDELGEPRERPRRESSQPGVVIGGEYRIKGSPEE